MVSDVKASKTTKRNATPATPEQRRALHRRLVAYARAAAEGESLKGIATFVRSHSDPALVEQIADWFEAYTAIRRYHQDGLLNFLVDPTQRHAKSLEAAALNPYYAMEPGNSHEVQRPEPRRRVAGDKVAHGVSDREFKRRVLLAATNEFLATPNRERQQRVCALMDEYRDGGPTRRGGNIFLQGGSPGLGKRR